MARGLPQSYQDTYPTFCRRIFIIDIVVVVILAVVQFVMLSRMTNDPILLLFACGVVAARGVLYIVADVLMLRQTRGCIIFGWISA